MTDSGRARDATPTVPRVMNGKYRLLRVLGTGGTGTVYEAENLETDRRVAIKTLHPRYAEQATVLKRFRQEARAPSTINHRNILDVLDMDQTPEGEWFIVEELLVGEDLGRRLEKRGPLPPAEALDLLSPIAEALSAAHRHKPAIIHRDVKPANIFLSKSDGLIVPKLIDFGIARWLSDDESANTSVGVRIGTLTFMSPEQADGDATVDPQTDIWSFGLVLYVALGAPNPFKGVQDYGQYRAALARGIPPLDTHVGGLPAELVAIVGEMVQPDRAKRANDMRAVAQRLHEIARRLGAAPPIATAPEASVASPSAPLPSPRPPPLSPSTATPAARSGRSPAVVVGLGVVAGALLLGGILCLTRRSVPGPKPPARDASAPDVATAPPPVPPTAHDASVDVPTRADVRDARVVTGPPPDTNRPTQPTSPPPTPGACFRGLPQQLPRGSGASAYNMARVFFEHGEMHGARARLVECVRDARTDSRDSAVCGRALRCMNENSL